MTIWLLVAAGLMGQAAPRSTLSGIVADATGAPVAGARVDISTAAPKVGEGLF